MLRIKQDVFLGFVIGGVDYPLEATGFNSLKIVSSRSISVPMVEMELVDSFNFFSEKVTLADGVQLKVLLGTSQEEYDTMVFRVFSFSDPKAGGSTSVKIIGYLDVVAYYMATANKPISGTSYNVLKAMADMAGMTFEGDATSDDQVWIPGNDRYCQWARKIVAHAYGNDMSLMALAVTPLKVMRYRDVMALDVSGDMPAFVNGDSRPKSKIFQMRDSHSLSRSGSNNASGAYGHRIVVQRANAELQTVRDAIRYKRFASFTNVAKDVRDAVKNAEGSPGVLNTQFSPIECGNVHEHYWEAQYQNARLSRLFSTGATLLVEDRTKIEVLDPVKYMPSSAPGATGAEAKEQVQGIYVVTSKAVVVQMGNYFERFELYTSGPSTDPAALGNQE